MVVRRKPGRFRSLLTRENLLMAAGLVLMAAFFRTLSLPDSTSPVVLFAIWGALVAVAATILLASRQGTLQFQSALATFSFLGGTFLVGVFFFTLPLAKSINPFVAFVLWGALLLLGLPFALWGFLARFLVAAQWGAAWLWEHRRGILALLSRRNLDRLALAGLVLASVGLYLTPQSLPTAPWMLTVVGLTITVTALVVDHDLEARGVRRP